MKIYFAASEPHNINKTRELYNVLLSYYDWIGPIPFRKSTFKILFQTKGEIKCEKKEQ